MKRLFFALAATTLLAFILFGCTNTSTAKKKEGGVLSVANLESNPTSFKETLTVTGVVARVSDKKTFAIIDTAEAKHCKSIGCAKFYLPVQFDGPTPKEWDEVKITGRIVDEKGLMLKAITCEVISHISAS